MLNEPGVDLTRVFTSLLAPELGVGAYERGDYADAARSFESAAQASSGAEKKAAYYGLAARSWVRCGKKDGAVRTLQMANRVAQGSVWDRVPSLIVFQLALEGDSNENYPMRSPQGRSHLTEEEQRLAYEVLRETGHYDFGPRATANLGVLEYRKGNLTTALSLLEQALCGTSRAARVQAAYNLGAIAEEQGDRTLARRYYWRAAWSRGNRMFSRLARRQLFFAA